MHHPPLPAIAKNAGPSPLALGMGLALTDAVRNLELRNDSTPSRNPLVLLAEDDPELRALMGYGLGLDGYEVVATANGVELATWMTATLNVALVMSDVRMPGPSGLEMLARFRRTNASTPFIVVTAFGGKLLHEQALVLGATAVVDKPFEMGDLRALVRRLVARRGLGTDREGPGVTLNQNTAFVDGVQEEKLS